MAYDNFIVLSVKTNKNFHSAIGRSGAHQRILRTTKNNNIFRFYSNDNPITTNLLCYCIFDRQMSHGSHRRK
jgi:hypothetical protein